MPSLRYSDPPEVKDFIRQRKTLTGEARTVFARCNKFVKHEKRHRWLINKTCLIKPEKEIGQPSHT